jgi:hypothetical protein
VNPLYVTSFTSEMYAVTGSHLVGSFRQTGSDGTLLVCYEGPCGALLSRADERIRSYDLAASSFLSEWLDANRDIIPVALGGAASSCECGTPHEPSDGCRPRCPFQWFNRNASRWFRKIASLDYALAHVPCDAIVWIDADCRFTQQLPATLWRALFADASVLYHRSPDRRVLESGVLAIRLDDGGRKFLTETIERFRTGRFREDARWDDGFQFQMQLQALPELAAKDLGTRALAENSHGDVLPSSPLGAYITHFKGIHRYLQVMS